jgi:hypothetical protein
LQFLETTTIRNVASQKTNSATGTADRIERVRNSHTPLCKARDKNARNVLRVPYVNIDEALASVASPKWDGEVKIHGVPHSCGLTDFQAISAEKACDQAWYLVLLLCCSLIGRLQ